MTHWHLVAPKEATSDMRAATSSQLQEEGGRREGGGGGEECLLGVCGLMLESGDLLPSTKKRFGSIACGVQR